MPVFRQRRENGHLVYSKCLRRKSQKAINPTGMGNQKEMVRDNKSAVNAISCGTPNEKDRIAKLAPMIATSPGIALIVESKLDDV